PPAEKAHQDHTWKASEASAWGSSAKPISMEFRCFPTMPAAAQHAWFFGNRSSGTSPPVSRIGRTSWASIAPAPGRSGFRLEYLQPLTVTLGRQTGDDAGFRPPTGGLEAH